MSKHLGFYPDFYDYSGVQKVGGKYMMQHRLNIASTDMHVNASDVVQYVNTVYVDLCKTVMCSLLCSRDILLVAPPPGLDFQQPFL